MKISEIHAYQIYDSRGTPTVACDLTLEDGQSVSASVASGASVGTHEAIELRDGGPAFAGRGVSKAVEHIYRKIAPVLVGQELDAIALDQQLLALDTTPQKNILGANAILPVSMALFRAHALTLEIELYDFIARSLGRDEVSLPIPLLNMINGGAHARNNLSFQEYLVIPYGARTFAQAIGVSVEIFYELKKLLLEQNKQIYTGDEGGFAPTCKNVQEPLELLMRAIERAGFSTDTVALGIDVAASQFYNENTKIYTVDGQELSAQELIEYYEQLIHAYPIMYLEDPLAQDDWPAWHDLHKRVGKSAHIVGDDLLVTHKERVLHAQVLGACNGAIIKPNQVGTVSESLDVTLTCQQNEWVTIASHRSGETCDTFIADFAVGAGATYLKCGGCSHGERLAKYNRLIQIECVRS